MNFISEIKKINDILPGQILFNEKLSKYSWFNLGGPAKVIFKPKSLNELSLFLKKIEGFKKIKIIGAGSNTLIRDGGFDGVIIKLGKSFSHLSLFDQNTIISGASALDKKVSNFALENSISGLEFLSCIPGTIGGGIIMNSGCYGGDVSKILVSVQVMGMDGKIRIINHSDINFYYRGSSLNKDLIIISTTLKGQKDNKLNIEKKINTFIKKKATDQPSKIKTCGSTFKNVGDNKAWKLIKESGCDDMKIGGAYISSKHCNFFVNEKNAKSNDIENLINQVKKKVFDKTGISLELEIQIIGEKK